ncbi:type II toxin-antitoxin system VapB family antitoxin [Sphingomonas sp.]|uniref:type II toxin-antitoxin system VapB family antitoxin n=1 Tax=Sphingomonas sp. TaxID=28214 RepID=UPI003B0051B2
MASQLNIKSDTARSLAEEAARLHGVSITEAVTLALRREVGVLRDARSTAEHATERENGFHDLIAGSRDLWKGAMLSLDHADLLYDECGLPR